MPVNGGPDLDGPTADAINLAKSFAIAGVPSIVVFNGHPEIFRRFEETGVDVRRIEMPISGVKQHFNPFYRRRMSRRLSRFIRDEGIDVLHLGHGGPYVLNYLKNSNVLKVSVQQGAFRDLKPIGLFDGGVRLRPKQLMKAWYRKYVRLNFNRADLVVCLSGAALETAIHTYGVNPDRAVAVYPAVTGRLADSKRGDVRREYGIGADEQVVLSVGRITKAKGVEDYGEVAKTLASRGKNYRFLFVGRERDGAYGRLIRKKYGRYVTFLGHRSDIGSCYADADLYMHTSHRESGPLTIVEAMEFGVPAVAWDIPGCNEQIVDGLNGSLLEFGDIDALADATERLLDTKAVYDQASAASVERFKRHDISDYAPRMMRAYRDAIAKRKQG